MMRNIGFAAIILTLLAAPHSIEQYQLAGGGDGCREGQYCTGATAGGKCHGKCIPEDLNHSLCITSCSTRSSHCAHVQHARLFRWNERDPVRAVAEFRSGLPRL